MYSAFDRTQRAFALVLVVTIVLAFAPRGLLGWTGDVAEIVRVPTRPFTHLGVRLGHWIRPPETMTADVPAEAREIVAHLEREVERFKQLYAAEQMEARRLRRTLAQLQRVPMESPVPVRLLSASIVARPPAGQFAPVQLNRGSSHGVRPGAIALYEGVHLVGRVSDVTPIGSTMVPLVNKAIGLIQAQVMPPDVRDIDKGEADGGDEHEWLVQLEVTGDGTFTAAVDESLPIQEGDEAIVDDPMWPDAARGMIIGRVTSIEDIEELPLRKRVVITPRFNVYGLANVTLKIEVDETELAGVTGGEATP